MTLDSAARARKVEGWMKDAAKVADLGGKGAGMLGQPEVGGVFQAMSVVLKLSGTGMVLADAWGSPLTANDIQLTDFEKLAEQVKAAQEAIERHLDEMGRQQRVEHSVERVRDIRTRLTEPLRLQDAYVESLRRGDSRNEVRGCALLLLRTDTDKVLEDMVDLSEGATSDYLGQVREYYHGAILGVRDQAAALDALATRAAGLFTLVSSLRLAKAREELADLKGVRGGRPGGAEQLLAAQDRVEAARYDLYRGLGDALDAIGTVRQEANRQLSACITTMHAEIRTKAADFWKEVPQEDDSPATDVRNRGWAHRVRMNLEAHWPFLDFVVWVWPHHYNDWAGFVSSDPNAAGWHTYTLRQDPHGKENTTHLMVAWSPKLRPEGETPLVRFAWVDALSTTTVRLLDAVETLEDLTSTGRTDSASDHAWNHGGAPRPGSESSSPWRAECLRHLTNVGVGKATRPVGKRMAIDLGSTGLPWGIIYGDYTAFSDVYGVETSYSGDEAPPLTFEKFLFEDGVEMPPPEPGTAASPSFEFAIEATDSDRVLVWGPALIRRNHETLFGGTGAQWKQVGVACVVR